MQQRGEGSRTIFERRESAVRSYCRAFPHVLTSGSGSLVRDEDGREYIDFLACAGALNYGHNDPDMKTALVDFITGDGIVASLDLHTTAKRRFLTAFEELVLRPRGLDYRVQFSGPAGTTAVEAALKLARKVTGRHEVIAFTNAFHGVSAAALAATGNGHHRMGPEQALHGVTRLPYDGYLGEDIDTSLLLERLLSDPSGGVSAPAAIILEVVQGEGGLNAASPEWLRRVAAVARSHGSLLVVDDIQAGCGRTGTFFSFEGTGVTPDLVTLSKSLSGFGLPLGVVLIRPDLDVWSPGEHNATFRGNGHAFVTGEVALRKFWSDDRLMHDVARRGALLESTLREVAASEPRARIKGRGMMRGIDFGSDERSAAVQAECIRRGVLIERAGPRDEVLKVMAPLTTDDDLLLHGLDLVREAVGATRGSGRGSMIEAGHDVGRS